MLFQNISTFSNINDYLPIVNGAIITDLVIILRVVLGQIKSTSLTSWYKKYGIAGVLADVLSITIGVIITRFIYPFIFTKYSLITFIGLAVIVQLVHDLLFAQLFYSIPRGNSAILDTFKEYANEFGPVILLADAAMIISTILIGSFLSTQSVNTNIIILLVILYLVPYFLYSI